MKLLFICTHNRCRSILAEAITNYYGDGIITARSAGSQPAGEVHPLSLRYLLQQGISTKGLYSKSWDVHENWQADVVITVCDSAAKEACPIWFGNALKVHWSLADPSAIEGSEPEIEEAFDEIITKLKNRVLTLKELAIQQVKRKDLAGLFDQVGRF